jgi:hypothetical protein
MGNDEILYKRSVNGGSIFSNIIVNISNNAGLSELPALAVSGSVVHVVWTDNTPGNPEIFYRRSLDDGSTFSAIIKNLSNNAGLSEGRGLAANGNNVYVVWLDTTPGNDDILYTTSADGGSTFSTILSNLSRDSVGSFAPAIAISPPTAV